MSSRGAPEDHQVQHKNHDAYFVPGLQRGLRVLEVFATNQRPLTITEIASELGLTRSAVFRLVYTLRHMGFLEESSQRLFTLGPRVLNIGFSFLASKDIIETARPELEALRDETQVSAHLAIRDGRDVLYLSCVQTRSGFLSNMNVGARVPAHASPMGWLLLSDLPAEELTALHRGVDLAPLTDKTPRSVEALAQAVRRAGQDGFAISRGVMEAGGSSVCAPVRDRRGQVVAAIDISGPDSAFDLDALETRYLDAVRRTAGRISDRIG
ncbi:IclR family transcriptional regulator [Roseomonas sp. AR75]|uniref:IclR family transcriptional regulator n=1 Tax=Roseomonas sp. AR75 TaxID=2562311 RepID=UPI0010C11CCA|nr:IclR family transcriptional regulator [Roseomonas sp. AR75]